MENEVNITPAWETFPAGFHAKAQAIMDRLNLPTRGRNYVLSTLANPSRRTRSGTANVSGAYASQKMGQTIGFESRTLEYSRIVLNEANRAVVGYVAQCGAIKIRYKCPLTGRIKSFLQTPDLLELYIDKIAVVDCKPLSILRQWAIDRPGFIHQDPDGTWRCPPAEAACTELGLEYWLVCEQDLPPMRIKNMKLLVDYIQTGEHHGRDIAVNAIIAHVSDRQRITIEQLLEALGNHVNVDDVYRAVAISAVTVDLDDAPLIDHERTYLYSSQAALESYKISAAAVSRAATWVRASVIDLKPGVELNWNGRSWHLLNAGLTKVTLNDGTGVHELDRHVFDKLLENRSIIESDGTAEEADAKSATSHQMLQSASPADLARALRAYEEILPHQQRIALGPPTRTQRRNLCRWRMAEASYGNGFVGLLPHFSRSGNRATRIDPAVMKIVRTQTAEHYATTKKSKRIHVHERIVAQCERGGLLPPSYAWYCSYIKRRPAYEMKKAREGRKAAYGIEPRKINDGSITDARSSTPFERAYLDHTEIELETRCSKTSVLLGRPWLTTLVDEGSGDVLAWYLTWDPPSYRSILMTLRDCVRRHGRLPDEIVVDGGKDMASIWFEVVAAFFCITITRRPAGKARFGARGERFFGTFDTTLLHNCAGNTQLRKNVRQMAPEVDPNKTAVWTMGALYEAVELYFERYRNLPHRELLLCPRELRERGLLAGSGRAERRIIYDRNFLISTCPTTKTGQAKVQADGVKINYLYYSAPKLRMAFGKKVPVRFDPSDMSFAYALIDNEWIEVTSRFANQLKGRTERELQVARDEYFRHRSKVEKTRLTEKTFITFLEYLDRTEEMLLDHHRANEMRRAAGVEIPEDDVDDDECNDVEQATESSPTSPFAFSGEDIVTCEVE